MVKTYLRHSPCGGSRVKVQRYFLSKAATVGRKYTVIARGIFQFPHCVSTLQSQNKRVTSEAESVGYIPTQIKFNPNVETLNRYSSF